MSAIMSKKMCKKPGSCRFPGWYRWSLTLSGYLFYGYVLCRETISGLCFAACSCGGQSSTSMMLRSAARLTSTPAKSKI